MLARTIVPCKEGSTGTGLKEVSAACLSSKRHSQKPSLLFSSAVICLSSLDTVTVSQLSILVPVSMKKLELQLFPKKDEALMAHSGELCFESAK